MSQRDDYKKILTNNDNTNLLFDTSVDKKSKLIIYIKKQFKIISRRFVRLFGLVKIVKPKFDKNLDSIALEDRGKRIKMLLSSFAFVLLYVVFHELISKFAEESLYVQPGLLFIVVISLYSAISIFLLVIIFSKDVDLKGFRKIILFSVVSMVGFVLFIELIFFKYFMGGFNLLLYAFVLLFFVFYVYVIFLTVNIFTVAKFKAVPLLQVAQTAGYIIVVLNTYFWTFGYLSLGFPVYFSWLLILVYVANIYSLIDTFDFSRKENVFYSFVIGWGSYLAFLGLILWPVSYRLISVFPTLSSMIFLGVAMSYWKKKLNFITVFEYVLIYLFMVYLIGLNANYT